MTRAEAMPYQLQLFVSGGGARSARAIVNVRRICEQNLPGRYHLDVIDISSNPARAKKEQLIAVPTLIRVLPKPVRRFIGDMSRTQTIVEGLDLPPLPEPPATSD
ncbi:circadian clock KaiB family protein [Piscinibacter sakaiensis]|uniref:circadian clock KaiB family protein n=1 Tax=Piscinibacter sakaiensis TaxID=1547922 RepID=UPI003AAAD1D6